MKNGTLSDRKASVTFGIPRSTIQNKMKENHPGKVGRKPVFTEIEEVSTTRVVQMCSWGLPLDMLDLRLLIKSYLTKRGGTVSCFKNNIPEEY